MTFKEVVENVGKAIDGGGVAVIVIGAVLATAAFIAEVLRRRDAAGAYRSYRQRLGRTILLGLELLVAADIIRTVAIDPTFSSAGVLAIIVAIRTFLSFSMEMEISGRWPWQQRQPDRSST